jgi:DNA-binding XRE family transcriptional regulator
MCPAKVFRLHYHLTRHPNKTATWSLVTLPDKADYGAYAVSVNRNFNDKRYVSKSKAVSSSLRQLGGNIRRERMAKGMTQQQLAEFADLNIRNLQRIEAGELDVLFSTAARIKKALDSSWEELLPKDWC